jgi:NADH:ubiquinone oxidoreductase subunit E
MGSSCFVRGNKENLKIIQAFLKEHKLKAEIEVDGVLCKNDCDQGPNICLNGEWYNQIIDKHKLRSLLAEKLLEN